MSLKILLRRALVLGALLVAAPALAEESRPALAEALKSALAVESFTLKNGMQAIVIPDHRMPVATHMVWYRIGAADEEPGVSGIAHFLEHLMFKGTKKIPPGEFSKIVARNGGQDNAFTSQDYTAYFQRVAVDRLPLVMEMEADRMVNLVLSDEVVTPERAVIVEERSMRIDNDPAAELDEQMDAALFLNHPYGIPIIGWKREMQALTREDAIAFYQRYYTPSDAILVVAGDVTLEEVKALAEKTYGRLKGREVAPRVRPQEPPPSAARRVDMVDARAKSPSFERRYLAPSYRTAEPGLAEAIEVLNDILGAHSTSLLYRRLVVEKGIAAAASSWYDGDAYDPSVFSVSAIPRQGVSLAEVEAGVDGVIAELLKTGVTAQDTDRAVKRVLADALYIRDNQFAMARFYGAALTSGRSIEDIEALPDRIAAVTPEAVMAAARLVLDMRRSVTGTLSPEPGKAEERAP
ncbi:MAG: insulinase family protein [Alphaproteobacteria bacterium]|nr:insulinase family protein [Alphaproteobacteria bacterium]